MALSSSPLDREEIVLVRCLVRPKIDRSIELDQLEPIVDGSEPDVLRRPQAHSRYRELCILPVVLRSLNDK